MGGCKRGNGNGGVVVGEITIRRRKNICKGIALALLLLATPSFH